MKENPRSFDPGNKVAQYWPAGGKLLSEFYRVCSSTGDSGKRWPDVNLQKLWTFVSPSLVSYTSFMERCKKMSVTTTKKMMVTDRLFVKQDIVQLCETRMVRV